jgi:hypothetical protein
MFISIRVVSRVSTIGLWDLHTGLALVRVVLHLICLSHCQSIHMCTLWNVGVVQGAEEDG